MKLRPLITAALLAAGSAGATDVDPAVEPRVADGDGHTDVGTMPKPPPVVYSQPVLVESTPVAVERPPIYVRVPPGHAKHWKKHCREYNACGERVLFVQERWYTEHYANGRGGDQGERGEHGEHHGDQGHGHGRGHDKHD